MIELLSELDQMIWSAGDTDEVAMGFEGFDHCFPSVGHKDIEDEIDTVIHDSEVKEVADKGDNLWIGFIQQFQATG